MKASQRFLPMLLALAMVAGSLLGQGTTSALTGRVEHEGTGLPGVTVTITSPSMQGERIEVTDINGNYNFPAIPPGDYTVVFTMDGMGTVKKATKVALASTQRVNAEMSLSAVAEAITITAAAPAVIETTEVQTNFTKAEVEALPVARTVQSVVALSPGVNTNGPGAQPRDASPRALVISGAQAYDSLFLVNGAVTNENLRGQIDNLFIEDAIEETTVLTGSISAEYGRFTGGVVSAITKSGGNEFSGSVRDSLTNPAWTDVSPMSEPKPDSNLNHTYEATLGGKILQDRLWFFGAGRYNEIDLPGYFTDSSIPRPTTIQTDERMEGKLTGQIAQGHNLVGSYLSYKIDQTPQCSFGCFDLESMDLNGRQLPREMTTASYNGVITNNFLIEAGYSTRYISWEDSGTDHVTTNFADPRDVALGMWAYDYTANGMWGSTVFCAVCEGAAETRENTYYNLKGTYYLATEATGTHNIVAGYENFAESRLTNNYQSGSNFDVYVYSGIVPTRTASGELRPVISAGDLLLWWPIFEFSQGSDFVTHSVFVNDKWDLNPNWSFNVGVRYDKNDGVDSAGNAISKDSNVSPRLGAIYDIGGDGRFRVNASYSRYVSRIQEGIGGNNGGGNPATFGWEYDGPDIGGPDSGMGSFDVLEEIYRWFLGIGGTDNTSHLVLAAIPGLNTIMTGDLRSPYVDEVTVGFGMQLGANGVFRADLIDRSWGDFYALYTTPNDQVEGPGGNLDNQIYGNSNEFERSYQAIQLQGAYRFKPRVNVGGNYTWSQIEGNGEGENAGSGPVTDSLHFYPEYRAFAANAPTGPLLSDQTHKARLWVSYDQPLGVFGTLNVSLLERFDSGRPYSAFTAALPVADYVDNPGYATPPDSVEYYFSDRGEFRWEDQTATDLALNWSTSLAGLTVFAEGEVLNVLDESAQINGNTSVRLLAAFDPFTETPVEGVHWAKGSNFGRATSVNHYQLPRTYRFSLGMRF